MVYTEKEGRCLNHDTELIELGVIGQEFVDYLSMKDLQESQA